MCVYVCVHAQRSMWVCLSSLFVTITYRQCPEQALDMTWLEILNDDDDVDGRDVLINSTN